MKNIFGIGLPRTGTSSLAEALRTLGYSGENYCILQNKREKDTLVPYDTFSFKVDNSFFNIYKELFYGSLDSKFILTTREADTWKKSIDNFLSVTNINNLPHISTYTQEVLKFFSDRGALHNLLVVDLFDNTCDSMCKWKNLYEFLEIDSQISIIKMLKTYPHVIHTINS